ncbi:hypothetical protein SAMN04488543_0604 [Friedmanniella luteola]|uniref:Uncharacterized protein n=1 Tax=Friedmanniella luteola TaxID=546871 RepID=A0A1H1MCR7_9ACTN|nr:hypothetical protein [Friedmanniella luteola]SDR84440.1 hypothetical protein SAMN04488543_0604 [Friedmanniella luteola]
MATWEDGPEYAPLERPAAFTSPVVEPLDPAPPHVQPAAGAPAERPLFAGPAAPVAPLAALVPVVADVRDPERPFEVVSSNLTSGGAWGSAHGGAGSGHGGLPTGPLAAAPPPAPVALPGTAYLPEALPAPAPVAPQQWPEPAPVPGGYPPPAPGAYPSPGTPQWFGPGPYGEQPAAGRVDARRVLDAATPGLLIVLGVGAVVFVLAPVMVAVAFALRSRVRAAQHQVRRTLAVALGAVGFFAFVGLVRLPLDFSAWWSFVGVWALLICWATLITVVALVHRALKRGPVAPPSYPNPWR